MQVHTIPTAAACRGKACYSCVDAQAHASLLLQHATRGSSATGCRVQSCLVVSCVCTCVLVIGVGVPGDNTVVAVGGAHVLEVECPAGVIKWIIIRDEDQPCSSTAQLSSTRSITRSITVLQVRTTGQSRTHQQAHQQRHNQHGPMQHMWQGHTCAAVDAAFSR